MKKEQIKWIKENLIGLDNYFNTKFKDIYALEPEYVEDALDIYDSKEEFEKNVECSFEELEADWVAGNINGKYVFLITANL